MTDPRDTRIAELEKEVARCVKTMAGLSGGAKAQSVGASQSDDEPAVLETPTEAGHPTPMPSADPARVGEEEQERRLWNAMDLRDVSANESIRMLVEYLRAEREWRKRST